MFDKANTGRLYGVWLASMYAFITTFFAYVSFGLNAALSLLLFLVLWVAIYVTGLWIFIYRPAELKKKYPITGRELRKRREEFLASLNPPRQPRR